MKDTLDSRSGISVSTWESA